MADFGLAAIRADSLDLLRTECGTRSYMAPEILLHEGYEGGKVSKRMGDDGGENAWMCLFIFDRGVGEEGM